MTVEGAAIVRAGAAVREGAAMRLGAAENERDPPARPPDRAASAASGLAINGKATVVASMKLSAAVFMKSPGVFSAFVETFTAMSRLGTCLVSKRIDFSAKS